MDVAWLHKAITWTNFDFLLVMFSGIYWADFDSES